MGRPPAYIFMARHGNRLDVADKQWHLSSPTPYDPPLTYGGWQQAKALGARIGAIIREKVAEDEEKATRKAADHQEDTKKKCTRYKVVLHSSPFLRCIQTSIAISAGLAQNSGLRNTSISCAPSSTDNAAPHDPSRARPAVVTDLRGPENGVSATGSARRRPSAACRPVLRLDAFLGEWLSPGYFELITPPPASVMMLASAKADLLRREDYYNYPNFDTRAHANLSGRLWTGSHRANPVSPRREGFTNGLDNMSSVADVLPKTESIKSLGRRRSGFQPREIGYEAPTPNYAISSSAMIPMGYVAHARDATVDIDYQWDSMRMPLDWGDGGSLGEEWTAMHKRFRKGFQRLVDWYSAMDAPTDMVTKTAARWVAKGSDEDTECAVDDTDSEAIVVLVTHGAGCNALIGAVTYQPVLMDVKMASLTMAVRKKQPTAAQRVGEAANCFREGAYLVHELYDLEICGSTDHLRTPSSSSNPPLRTGVTPGATRTHHSTFSASLSGSHSYHGDSASRPSSVNGVLSSSRGASSPHVSAFALANASTTNEAGITVGSGVTSFLGSPNKLRSSGQPPAPSVGLWSPIERKGDTWGMDDDEEDAMGLLNFSHERSTISVSVTNDSCACGNGEPAPPPSEHRKAARPIQLTLRPGPTVPASDSTNGLRDSKDPLTGLWSTESGSPSLTRDLSSLKRRWSSEEGW